MHVLFGDYHVNDVQFVAAFDVDAKKVGFDLSEATQASENNTIKIADVPPTGVIVHVPLDGLGKYYRETIEEAQGNGGGRRPGAPGHESRRARVLPARGLGAGGQVLRAVRDRRGRRVRQRAAGLHRLRPGLGEEFADAGLPVIGDVKSQVGATITHRVMKLFEDRGAVLDRTYQLNVGGNMDFKNMLERERLESKKISKTRAVTSNVEHDLGARNIHIGPSDYVQWLDDRKWAFVRLEGRAFGDVPLNLEYKLEVWDSPNSAGIIIDAIRAAKIAKDRGIGGPIVSASSYLMKSPPVQLPDDEGPTPRGGLHPRRGVTCR